MDTKSKNISRSKALKGAAAIIMVLAFFVSGYSAWAFFEGFGLYNGCENETDYTKSYSFGAELNSCEYQILACAEYLSCNTKEDFMKTSAGQALASDYKALDKAYDILDKSNIEIYVDGDDSYRYSLSLNGQVYYFSYNGDIINEYEFLDYIDYNDYYVLHPDNNSVTTVAAAPVLPPSINDVSNALAALSRYTDGQACYGELNRDDLKSKMYTNALSLSCPYGVLQENSDGTLRFETGFSLDSGFSYAIRIKSTGKTVSNCGVASNADYKTALNAMSGADFSESYANGVTSSKRVGNKAPDNLLDEYSAALFVSEPNWAYRPNDNIEYAVFSCDTSKEDSVFLLGKEAIEKFKSTPLSNPTESLAVFAISFAIACAACIYLLCVAGKSADGEIKISFFDKVPLIINFALTCVVAVGCCAAVVYLVSTHLNMTYYDSQLLTKTLFSFSRPICALAFSLTFPCITAFLCSIARNLRNHTFIRHTLTYWIIKPVAFICKKVFARLKFIFACDYAKGKGKKFKYISFAVVLLFFIINLFPCFACVDVGWPFFGLLWILLTFVATAFMLILISSLDRIMHGVADTRSGNLNVRINTALMPQFLRDFANNISSMQDGLKNAVESAVKDQKMKAELITNVSHDLKTPLTSIVNYVDLLKRCDVENEDAKKYIDILDEKSQRMKKLIEDLVEASKASSGAVELHPIKINLCEFAAQAVGEHEDELREKNIELVLKLHTQPVMIFADSQKTSRIIENLFSNIRKYALEGTRVYIDVNGGANYGTITFRNISKFPLDIEPEELTQRFVRGDASRSGEGSGLGLSIANDLCELQKGKFSIAIDGDLFKISVAMPAAK